MIGYYVMLIILHLFISRGNISDEISIQMKGRLSSQVETAKTINNLQEAILITDDK